MVPWAENELIVTDPDDVDFEDIKSSKQSIDDVRSRASYLTLGSKYSKHREPNVLHASNALLAGRKSAAAKEVDYFNDKKHGRDNMSVKELQSIRDGELVLSPLKSILKNKDYQPINSQARKDGDTALMDNPKLAELSKTLKDDSGCQVDVRCICLVLGEHLDSNAFTVSVSFNIFDEPTKKKQLEARAQLF